MSTILVTTTNNTLQRLDLLKVETQRDTITFDRNWGKDLIVDDTNIGLVKEAYTYADKAQKLMKSKVEKELELVYDWKEKLLSKLRQLNPVIKELESYADQVIYEPYLNRKGNLMDKMKDYTKQKEEARKEVLKIAKEEAQRLAEANKKALEDATKKVLASGANPEAVKLEEQKRLAILKEHNDLVLAQVAEANKKISTTKTNSGNLQNRISYKLDTENVDKLKVLQFALDNLEHLDLIEVNVAYANKVFKPTGNNPNPVIVKGLPFVMDVSLIVK